MKKKTTHERPHCRCDHPFFLRRGASFIWIKNPMNFLLGGSIDRSLGRVLLGKCWSRLEVFARQQWLRFAQGTSSRIQWFFFNALRWIAVELFFKNEGELKWVSFFYWFWLSWNVDLHFFKGNPLNLTFCAIDLGSQVDPNKNRNMTRCCDSPDCKWISEGLNFQDSPLNFSTFGNCHRETHHVDSCFEIVWCFV